ncbi:Uncharacterized protein FWK35_00003089, partial [Aphis craccivora]
MLLYLHTDFVCISTCHVILITVERIDNIVNITDCKSFIIYKNLEFEKSIVLKKKLYQFEFLNFDSERSEECIDFTMIPKQYCISVYILECNSAGFTEYNKSASIFSSASGSIVVLELDFFREPTNCIVYYQRTAICCCIKENIEIGWKEAAIYESLASSRFIYQVQNKIDKEKTAKVQMSDSLQKPILNEVKNVLILQCVITSRNNAPISNYGGGFRCKSEYPWCIIE